MGITMGVLWGVMVDAIFTFFFRVFLSSLLLFRDVSVCVRVFCCMWTNDDTTVSCTL